MAIILRTDKGSQLTYAELDGNFTDLDVRVTNATTIAETPVVWNNIQGKPDLFDGDYASLENAPTVPVNIGDLNNVSSSVPNIGQVLEWSGTEWFPATVSDSAFSGSYDDLTNKPVLFSGSYTDLTNQPTIPTDINQLSDNDDLLSGATYTDASVDTHLNVSEAQATEVLSWDGANYTWVSNAGGAGATALNDLTDVDTSGLTTGSILKYNGATWVIGTDDVGSNTYTDTDVDAHLNQSLATDGQVLSWDATGGDYVWVAQSGGSSFSGSYNDLTDKPTIPSDISELSDTTNLLFDGTYSSLTGTPTIPSIGNFTFTSETIDTVASAAITVTPDITFNGAVTISSLASVSTGNLAFTSAASVNITATDDINLSATNITGLGNEAYDNFSTSTSYNPGGAIAHGNYFRNEADTTDVAASVTVTSGFSKIKVELDASIANITDATTEMVIALERTVDGLNPTDVKTFLFPVANTFYGSQHFLYVDTHGASAGSTVEYKLRVDMSAYSNESARGQYGICGDTLYIKEIR
jgi:hypothetical protein